MSDTLIGLKMALTAIEYLESRGIRLSDVAVLKATKGEITIEDLISLEDVTAAARVRALQA